MNTIVTDYYNAKKNATVYVAEKIEKFKIRFVETEFQKGWFFMVRLVWNIRTDNGAWWQLFIFHFVIFFILMPVALVLDMVIALVRGILYLTWIVLQKSFELLFEVLKALFLALINAIGKPLAWGLIIIVTIVLGIIFYNNWSEITLLINKLVSEVI